MKISRPEMFKEAESARVKNIFLQILIFYAVFFVIAFAESIIPMIMMFTDIFSYIQKNNVTVMNKEYIDYIASLQNTDKNMIAMLISTVFGTLLSIIYCKFIEKRPLSSMGVRKNKGIQNYLLGMLIGFIMLAGVVLINVVSGAMNFDGLKNNLNIGLLLLYLLGFIIQGMSEEFIFRGFLMNSIGGKHNMVSAVVISAIAFSLAHISNSGVTPLALINIFLFGAFMSMYMIFTDNIWGVSAIHSIWNFSQGNIFGISVSGTGSGETVFVTSSLDGKSLMNGGEFGIEGGIATTIILLISFAVLFAYMIRKNKADQK